MKDGHMKDAMITQPLGTKLLFDGKRVIEIKKKIVQGY